MALDLNFSYLFQPIAFFFTLHNASEVVYVCMERLLKRDVSAKFLTYFMFTSSLIVHFLHM